MKRIIAIILSAVLLCTALVSCGNDGTDDYHLAPFAIKNSIDWREVVTALREIGYEGLFNLEIPGEIKGEPPLYVRKQKLKYLKQLADYMLSPAFPEQPA